jgi:2-keto-3-deoxy-L-fuconate dehydrogenase
LYEFSLQNRVAAVTGGASGIGRTIAELFSARGALAHILDFDEAQARSITSTIVEKGHRAAWHRCDVSKSNEVDGVFQKILNDGVIDILVNSAGVAHVGNLELTSEADLDRLYSVNVKGVYNCMRACIESMKRNRKGVILNIASIAASLGIADRFAYSMTKGAVLSMTYSVAKDYLPYNIRCNSISPARVHTQFVDGFLRKNYPGREEEMLKTLARAQPIGRMGNPEEVAALALFLCSDEASFITGTDYPLDGGALRLSY